MSSEGILRVERLSELRFKTMAEDWQACLSASNAHSLFMSWPWLYSWWETWSQTLGLELVLLGVFDAQGKLVGIGPFYRRDLILPLGLRVRRLHLIGSAWRIAPTVRTEYCGLILCEDRAADICSVLINAISQRRWDEWVLCDVVVTELERLSQHAGALDGQTGRIFRMQDEGVRLDTRGEFRQWLTELGSNTRLKVYNRRDYLRGRGELDFTVCDPAVDGDPLEQLNEFHMARWGKPAFDEEALRFHRRLMDRLPDWKGQVNCSVLRFNGVCVSVLYDVTIGGQRLNLQSGYLENLDRRVSLGSLHLGFAIEEAFEDPSTTRYDLLAGAGKNYSYKHHFRGKVIQFNTVQLVRRRSLRFIYLRQSSLPSGWRRIINRWFRL